MGIFSRMSDIVNANLNALLEKAEDPEKIIRLMIQEMEETLVEVRTAAAKCIAEKKEIKRQLQTQSGHVEAWQEKAELAIDKDRDDLARAALAEKSAAETRKKALEEERDLVSSQLDKFNDDISQLQNKLEDAKARQRALVMRHKSAQSQLKARRHIHSDKLEDMMFRFEVAERRIEQVESRGEALDLGRKRTLSEEIDSLRNDDTINAELDALKERMAGRKPRPKAVKNRSDKSGETAAAGGES